jgi:3-keto-disaccharide hydrolase
MSLTLRLIPIVVALALSSQTPEPGFTSLWNGKDFTDWKVANPSTFTITDGAMVANGSQGHAFYDGPFRNHMFRDFELKVDVMTKPGSNGGIFILTEYQDKGWPAKGFEIQVNNTFKNDPVRTGSLYHVSDIKEAPAKDDEWFTEHIIVKGDTITIRVNDKQVVTWTSTADSPHAKRMAPGTIALQAHDPGSTVYYKNIRIKPLD